MVVLVGGFGESKYLYHFLDTANKNTHPDVRVLQDRGAYVINQDCLMFGLAANLKSWWQSRMSAVCRGATLWGLDQTQPAVSRSITSRISRHSYGIAYCHSFDPGVHNESDKFFNEAKGEYYAEGQMKWLLNRV